MKCARQICLWRAGGGTSESAVSHEANANLSKMLIFDFFQISETQADLGMQETHVAGGHPISPEHEMKRNLEAAYFLLSD